MFDYKKISYSTLSEVPGFFFISIKKNIRRKKK